MDDTSYDCTSVFSSLPCPTVLIGDYLVTIEIYFDWSDPEGYDSSQYLNNSIITSFPWKTYSDSSTHYWRKSLFAIISDVLDDYSSIDNYSSDFIYFEYEYSESGVLGKCYLRLTDGFLSELRSAFLTQGIGDLTIKIRLLGYTA